jgi:hypothetical protein
MSGRDHPDRGALGEGAEGVEGADPGADVGAAGDHRLLRLARARSVENFQLEPMLLEEAGILPELGERVLPGAGQAPGNLQPILRGR